MSETTARDLGKRARRGSRPVDTRDACVICATPRTGSWLLAEGLMQTGVAGRPEEYLRPDWFTRFAATGTLEYQHRLVQSDPWPGKVVDVVASPMGSADVRAFMDAVSLIAATSNGVAAIKVHWHQFEALRRILGAGMRDPTAAARKNPLDEWFPSAAYVFLRRRNKVRQAISYSRAMHTEIWWSARGSSATTQGPDVAPQEIERLRRRLVMHERRWEEFFEHTGIEPLELVYEDLARDPRRAVAAVIEHLGLAVPAPDALPGPRLKCQADGATDRLEREYFVQQRSGALHAGPTRRRHGPRQTTTRTEIVVANNFYADPERVRDYALGLSYYFPYVAEADVVAGRVRPAWLSSRFLPASECSFKSSAELIARLEELTGESIDLDHWRADFPTDAEGKPAPEHGLLQDCTCIWNCAFHCKLASDQRLGDGVHNHVTDAWNGVGRDGWAGIVYLGADGEAPLQGGLKLWRNRDPVAQFDWMTDRESWELVDDLGNVPNRLLLCRGDLPHSGAAGWGDGLLSGRLFQTFFFKTMSPVRRPSLSITL